MLHRFRVWLNSRWYRLRRIGRGTLPGEVAGPFVVTQSDGREPWPELARVEPRKASQAKALDPARYRKAIAPHLVADTIEGPSPVEIDDLVDRRIENVRAKATRKAREARS